MAIQKGEKMVLQKLEKSTHRDIIEKEFKISQLFK